MSTCIFPSKRNGLASHRAVSLAQKQKDKRCNNIPKKKRPYDTMDAAKAKGSPKTRPCFHLVAPQPTVRSSRKSRYLLEDGVWRGLQVFLSSTSACRTTRFGSYASSAHPQFMRTPLWRSGLKDRILLYCTQPRPCWDQVLCSSIFHLAHSAAVQTTASISESGNNGSGSCREAVKEVEQL